jgi:hypothetical protein
VRRNSDGEQTRGIWVEAVTELDLDSNTCLLTVSVLSLICVSCEALKIGLMYPQQQQLVSRTHAAVVVLAAGGLSPNPWSSSPWREEEMVLLLLQSPGV